MERFASACSTANGSLTNKALRVGADPDADVRAPFRQSVYLVANVQAVRDAAAAPGLPAGKPDVQADRETALRK